MDVEGEALEVVLEGLAVGFGAEEGGDCVVEGFELASGVEGALGGVCCCCGGEVSTGAVAEDGADCEDGFGEGESVCVRGVGDGAVHCD